MPKDDTASTKSSTYLTMPTTLICCPNQRPNNPIMYPNNPKTRHKYNLLIQSPTPAPTANVMSNEQFNNLRNAVKDSNFDDQRLEIAKQGIKANTLSIDQIRALIDVFSFESSKVEIAKFAYNYTPDKNRYTELYSVFKFSSSTDEVIKYISTPNDKHPNSRKQCLRLFFFDMEIPFHFSKPTLLLC
jgi:hypothetical protein